MQVPPWPNSENGMTAHVTGRDEVDNYPYFSALFSKIDQLMERSQNKNAYMRVLDGGSDPINFPNVYDEFDDELCQAIDDLYSRLDNYTRYNGPMTVSIYPPARAAITKAGGQSDVIYPEYGDLPAPPQSYVKTPGGWEVRCPTPARSISCDF